MADAVQSFETVTFWWHRGLWADWSKYLVDGVHFIQEGNQKYYNSVRGAIIAAANTLKVIGRLAVYAACFYLGLAMDLL